MAKPDAILRADRSAASHVALLVLCGLAALQLVLLGHAFWLNHRTAQALDDPQVLAALGGPPPAAQPTPPTIRSLNVPSGLPPLPGTSAPVSPLTAGALPPLPPLPGTAARTAPGTARSVPFTPPPQSSNPVSRAPSPPPAPSIPSTGKPEVDSLIEVAVQSRDLGNDEGALKALDRADLILPDNPIVLRQRAITLGKLGQTDKANAIWTRLSQTSAPAGVSPASSAPSPGVLPPVTPPAAPPPDGLSAAFGAQNAGGPITIGTCLLGRDPAAGKGETVILKVPLRSVPGAVIDQDKLQLDVFFYDKVDDQRVEPTQSDKPVYSYDPPFNQFKTGEEVVKVVYHMPELTPQEIASIGRRQFYGYVVKLYYLNRLAGSAAAPRELLAAGNPPPAAGTSPALSPAR